MTHFRGRAADRAWQHLPGTAGGAAVDSSFEHALNLRVPGGLLTLVTRDGRPAPGVLITDAATLPRVAAGTTARREGSTLEIGRLTVGLTGCTFFSCRVARLPAATATAGSPRTRARQALDALAAPGSFRTGTHAQDFEQAMSRRLTHGAQTYRGAIGAALTGDPDGLTPAAAALIGLGTGLTPSGDDYLVGALAVLTLNPATSTLRRLLAHAVTVKADTTTPVGGHYLRAAADRCFHHDITRAARCAVTRSDDLEAAFEAVAAIGSTSGTDTLTGIVDTLDALTPTHL